MCARAAICIGVESLKSMSMLPIPVSLQTLLPHIGEATLQRSKVDDPRVLEEMRHSSWLDIARHRGLRPNGLPVSIHAKKVLFSCGLVAFSASDRDSTAVADLSWPGVRNLGVNMSLGL
ncbi:hypothetical protein AC578_4114 [Pseudocercospora eumusae]|uniref:Uncharacterized protein n=1 Tax=Pseudocercospora eumusae TaxID=321146 RepID=A0A139HF22_9PEZI|nr:hypothetical protein AC578_4114 [Pseudocercospora eumusae]